MSVSGVLGHFGGSLGVNSRNPVYYPPGFLNVSLGGAGALWGQFGGEFQKPCLIPPVFVNVSPVGSEALWGQFGGEFLKPILLPPPDPPRIPAYLSPVLATATVRTPLRSPT